MVRIHQKTSESESEGAVTGLAVDKVFYAAAIAGLWVCGEAAYKGGDLDLWPSFDDPKQWLLILFISAGPSALSNILQFKGLSKLKPSEGQVILSTVPLFAILFSLLIGETFEMGGLGVGGLLSICFSVTFLIIAGAIE